jgi:hypothetical protein
MALSTFDEVFGVDEDLAANGVWVNFGKKLRVKLGYQGEVNKRFLKAAEKFSRPYKRDLKNDTLDNDAGRDILHNILAEGVVFDWQGATDEAGQEIKFSVAECLKAFKHPKHGAIFTREVNELSSALTNFRLKEVEADEKN